MTLQEALEWAKNIRFFAEHYKTDKSVWTTQVQEAWAGANDDIERSEKLIQFYTHMRDNAKTRMAALEQVFPEVLKK